MEQINQNIKPEKSINNKKILKYLIYLVVLLVVIFLGIKLLSHKSADNQDNNQIGNETPSLVSGNGDMGGEVPPDDAGAPPSDSGTNSTPPAQPSQNPN